MKIVPTTLVLCIQGDQILLAMKKRGFGAGKWNGPGGKIEAGESPEAAMIRECEEEVGITPLIHDQVAFHDFVLDADTSAPWRQHNYTFICTKWQGEPVETEEMRPQWFDIAHIPYDEMWADDIHWLPKVLDGALLRTKFEFATDQSVISTHIEEVSAL